MMLAVPEALAGGVFFQFLFPKILHGWSAPPVDFSVAIWVGYIAAFGMATETGIIMLVYLARLSKSAAAWRRLGRSRSCGRRSLRGRSTGCVPSC